MDDLIASAHRSRRAIRALLALALLCGLCSRGMASSPLIAQVVGTGQPVIAVAGLSTSGDVWRPMATRLGKDFQFHLVTLAGFAGTHAADNGKLIPSTAGAIIEYAHARHLQHPILLGHGVGGMIVLQVAEDAPELASHIVLIDTLPFLGAVALNATDAAAAQAGAARFRDAVEKASPADFLSGQRMQVQGLVTSEEDRARVLGWIAHSDQTAVAATLYESLTTDLRPHLGGVKARTLVLMPWIAPSPFTPEQTQKFVEFQYRGLEHAQIQVISNTRSFMMLDQAAALDTAFRQFAANRLATN